MPKNTAQVDLRAELITTVLNDAPDPTDHERVRKFMHRLAEAGCSVLFIYPGSKKPADMRTPQRRTADDRAARETARAAGQRGWETAKSPAGLALATTDVDVLDRYFDYYLTVFAPRHPDGVPVNLAVEVGTSGLVVVDCDTSAQVAAFLDAAGADSGTPPTVRSPGHTGEGNDLDDPNTWAHRDGGHFWFTMPEGVELPASPGAMTWPGDDGFAVLWNRRYVLIPPSVRAEGPYTKDGDVHELPDWLAESITQAGAARAARAERSRTRVHGADTVTQWGAQTSWVEILGPTQWVATGKMDSCGCEIWTAPGIHASPKSATAHEPGCTYNHSADPHLQVWTDHDAEPFEHWRSGGEASFPVSRLQAVAAIHYDNNLGAAMTDLSDAYDDLAVDLPADFGRETAAGGDETDGTAPGEVTLPESFWQARDSLRHIRDAALKNRAAPDATLATVLARIAGSTPPRVTVDTGIMSPVSLNFYAAAVSWSGKGKSSAMEASEQVLDLVPGWSTDPMADVERPVMVQGDEPFPKVGKIRSGEGIAEMFWGEVTLIGPNNKAVKTRQRVRSNVLMHTDEAASLVKYILDPKQTVGETLREAWSNQHTGQSNADGARYRFVARGTYRLALIVGFHLSVLAEILTPEQTLLGTPQRFYVAWSKPDPKQVSREMLKTLADPGLCRVVLPATGMRLCAPLRDKVDHDRITEWLRDDAGDNEPDLCSQRVAMVARLAALLAILDGRTDTDLDGLLVITEADWELAETMFETSLAIASLAISDRQRRQARTKRNERQRNLMESIEDEDARSSPVGRAKARIIGYLTGMGKVKWSGKDGIREQNFNGEHAKHAETALAELVSVDRVRETTGPRKTRFVELIK
ncbi:bifunctional DNA primase/polymerase [Mycobacterium gordonae]|uniref:bifunctional DNA primase/polymerase n=1 Tax=Mycobacterium gordonae TaxID=1778 RepID=UPI00210D7A2D|nr:bifunctional DNA primase/polymerase [Mycobacterium gordonae]MCQ4360615.1 bifunctional DNA primase/polymerase [Mycobacterium gordonae]